MKPDNSKRTAAIIAAVEIKKWSYGLVARKLNIDRNVVAGVMFRHRHPIETLKPSPNSKSGSRNKAGTGYCKAQFHPKKTLQSADFGGAS